MKMEMLICPPLLVILMSLLAKRHTQKPFSASPDGDTLYLQSSGNGELSETDGEVKITKPLENSIFAVNAPIEIKAALSRWLYGRNQFC